MGPNSVYMHWKIVAVKQCIYIYRERERERRGELEKGPTCEETGAGSVD
jgi:hypothetical protein